jgi:ribose transport system ATP-binding protein
MEGIEKSFPGVQALRQGRFELRSGEVHALCGENGAGKSTLMKILAGIYPRDAGRVVVGGEEVTISSPGAALKRGISIIHQELNLMPHLTVAQNIFIGREPTRGPRFWLDEKELNARTAALFERMHLKLDPQAIVGDLTIAMQQMVEIAKALSYNTRVLIMDEPTAALTDTEITDLFALIRQLRANGTGIVHISHRLEELKQIADRVTVMPDGNYIDTLPIAEASIERIIRLMVGRTIYEERPSAPNLGEKSKHFGKRPTLPSKFHCDSVNPNGICWDSPTIRLNH